MDRENILLEKSLVFSIHDLANIWFLVTVLLTVPVFLRLKKKSSCNVETLKMERSDG